MMMMNNEFCYTRQKKPRARHPRAVWSAFNSYVESQKHTRDLVQPELFWALN